MAELADNLHGKMTNLDSSNAASVGGVRKRSGRKTLCSWSPRSVDGTVSAIEYLSRMSLQTDMDKQWSDRKKREDNISAEQERR